MKRFLLAIPLLLFLWFCSKDVLSHVVSVAIDFLLGYYVLFLLCNRLVTKHFNNHKEMFEEYKIIGVARVVLTTFFDFGDALDPDRILKKILCYFKNSDKLSVGKSGKPHIKMNRNKDIIVIFNALIEILNNVGKDKICKGIDFKHLVEDNFAEKWGYFYHSKYIGGILRDINNLCFEKNLPALGVLCTYTDGKLAEGYVKNCKENNMLKDGITENTKITDNVVQELIKKDMFLKLDNYKKIFSNLAGNDKNILS